MAPRTKRTYQLSERTILRVRELSARYGVARSQDAVVDVAVDRLYRAVADAEEGERWEAAASDPEFVAEAEAIATDLDPAEGWPA